MPSISGQIVDVVAGEIYPGTVSFDNDRIVEIKKIAEAPNLYIMPGLVDAHIHIESTMLVPSEFARVAVVHGTVATVSDPHEIGNVIGVDGVIFMIENGKTVPFNFYFGAPSCVPATVFETAGATIDAEGVKKILERDDVVYLSEMMNYPGVINKDPEVMKKIEIAKKLGKLVDGHAPGLRGQALDAYIAAGITTDHETFTYEEGEEKLKKGMKVIIREGSAARNFEALIPLLDKYPDHIMFCTDDQMEGFENGHMNLFLRRAVARGSTPMAAIRACTRNPVFHYGLKTGLLQVGDPATFIVAKDLKDFRILETYINGDIVACKGRCLFETKKIKVPNHFKCSPVTAEQIEVKAEGKKIRVIEAIDGELITREVIADAKIIDGYAVSDTKKDILKLVVVNRYKDAPPAVAFIKNIGLKHGAIGSTVAHDSHNIIATGVDDASIVKAINLLIQSKGGLVVVDEEESLILPLPVAGLMSTEPGEKVAEKFAMLDKKAKELGATLQAPFMTLSFMALLVIPDLKLSDKGLFNGKEFTFVSLFQ